MEPKTSLDIAGDKPEELLPWHKPGIQEIKVSLDTGAGGGSFIDGGGFGPIEVPSDIRLKRDIFGISNALAGILALRGAENLAQAYPEIVGTRKDGFKAVKYAQLVPVLVEAIKQQQAMIEDLQSQVRKLQ